MLFNKDALFFYVNMFVFTYILKVDIKLFETYLLLSVIAPFRLAKMTNE